MTTQITYFEERITKNSLSIKSVYVENLFGYFTYQLPENNLYDSFDKLMILYGDNGSGKTTVLKLVFNLLSENRQRGHRSFIAKTKFGRVSVKLSDDIEVGAYRDNDENIGSYTYYIRNNSITKDVFLKTDNDGDIVLKENDKVNDQLEIVLKEIESLKLSLYFLSDDRKSMSNSASYNDIYLKELYDNRFDEEEGWSPSQRIYHREKKRQKEELTNLIGNSLNNLTQWIRKQVIYFSNIGETNNQTIYTDLISSVSDSRQNKKTQSKEDLIKTIQDLSKKSEEYSRLGLISQSDYKRIYDSIESVKNTDTINFINSILEPFIEGSNAKLLALENIKNTIKLLISSVNSYFTNKRINFNLNTGFNIRYINGDDLSFEFLSSGEKQLLLLFINTITASDDATIFIIDEPEISLNIKWQRKLLKTLLSFSVNRPVQFIIATHSVELLTSNSNRVVRLDNKPV